MATDIDSLQKNKYAIIIQALMMGFPVKYNSEWDLILHEGTLYENFYSKKNGRDMTRKSTLTLQDFFNHFGEIHDQDLKQVFSNIRLHKFQQKLIAQG